MDARTMLKSDWSSSSLGLFKEILWKNHQKLTKNQKSRAYAYL